MLCKLFKDLSKLKGHEQLTLITIHWDLEKQFEKLSGDLPDMKKSDISKFKELTPVLKKHFPEFYKAEKAKLDIINSMPS
ncbi:hypothetical protein [Sebaldella sp. S0638]|uniref:hypothetical protein n=1 Tax=Sebaldella sp. S0638 TaxID=2957809 RepID=UPI00209FA0E3|nr:hypothetical protein [Sebaldella sp. S0638]MCP1225675.1 hypothetical protein [Sebaldella sp. S0638]